MIYKSHEVSLAFGQKNEIFDDDFLFFTHQKMVTSGFFGHVFERFGSL